MSVPKQLLHELIDLLPEEKTCEVINLLQGFINKANSQKQTQEDWNPEDFIGILDNLDIDIEEECKNMRKQWNNRGWDAISN